LDRAVTATEQELRAVELWFMARGTPHLMEGYSATEDVFTRTLPVFTLVFLLEVGGALNADFTWWQNVLAALGAMGIVVGAWAGINVLRGRRALTRPARVGLPEVLIFVLAPGLGTAVIGGQWAQGLTIAVVNLLLLGTIYLVASYGLIPLTRWALGKTVRELGAVAGLLGRALPLLLLFQIVLFVNTEMWQVADAFDRWLLGAVIGLFVLIGLSFLITRLPRELDRLATFASVEELEEVVAGTPATSLVRAHEGDLHPAPLSARQRGNVLLVALFSQGLQVLLVTLIVGGFFVVFGLLTIEPETVMTSWLEHGGHEVAVFWIGGHEFVVTKELLKVSIFLAAFSGLYFTVVLVTDATYREEFFDEILAELRQSFAVRSVYLRARGASDPPP
jgi:hypothetical protein